LYVKSYHFEERTMAETKKRPGAKQPADNASVPTRPVSRAQTTAVFQRKSLATTEARKALPQLVNKMSAKSKPSADLMQDAIDIGPHRKGGAVLLPGVDLAAHATEVAELRARVEQLEEDLEDAGMALFLQERLATTSGRRLTTQQFLTGIGMEGHIEQLPER
jgi:hypothetical protein